MPKATSKPSTPVKGGKGKMFGQMGAKPSKPGVISHSQPGKTAFGVKGGKGKMFSEMEAGPQKPGMTGPGGASAPETQFASGGKTKMFGKQSAMPAKGSV
jgi:hypothetical protein